MTGAADRFEIDIVTTLDDQIAFTRHVLAAPPISTMRRRGEILAIATTPLWCFGGILGAWLATGDRPPFREFVGVVMESPTFAVGGLIVAFAAMVLGLGFNRLFARRRVVALLRRSLRERADIDPADPTLAHRTRSTFDADGIASETPLGRSFVKWAAIRRLDETSRHLFLVGGPTTGFMVPKRQLEGDGLDRLKALILANLARRADQ